MGGCQWETRHSLGIEAVILGHTKSHRRFVSVFSKIMAENGDQLHEQDYTYENDQETFPEVVDAGEAAGDSEITQAASDEVSTDDPELEAIKARVREMEEEAEKLKEMQSEVEKQMNLSSSSVSKSFDFIQDPTNLGFKWQFFFLRFANRFCLAASPQPATPGVMTIEEKVDADSRSVYVGNVSAQQLFFILVLFKFECAL